MADIYKQIASWNSVTANIQHRRGPSGLMSSSRFGLTLASSDFCLPLEIDDKVPRFSFKHQVAG